MGNKKPIIHAQIASPHHNHSTFLIFSRKNDIQVNIANPTIHNNKAFFQSHIIPANCGSNNNNHKIHTNLKSIS